MNIYVVRFNWNGKAMQTMVMASGADTVRSQLYAMYPGCSIVNIEQMMG